MGKMACTRPVTGCVAAQDNSRFGAAAKRRACWRGFRVLSLDGSKGMAHMSVRLAAGRSCSFLKLVAGEAAPAPPGRGLCPLPSPLRGALPPRPPNGGKCPPYPPLKGRGPLLRGKGKTRAFDREKMTHRSARLEAGRSCLFLGLVAAPWPPKGGGVPPYPPLTGRVAPAGRAAFLPTARAGAWPHRTSRPLACRKGGKPHAAARWKHANTR